MRQRLWTMTDRDGWRDSLATRARVVRFGGICAAVCLLAGGVAYAVDIDVDADRSAPFSTYKTYAWTGGTPSPNPIGERRIHAGVDAHLAGRGLVPSPDAPDIYVATHVTSKERRELISNGFGGWYGGFGTVSMETYIEGTLVVDIYAASSKRLVWRGVANGTVSDKAAKNAEKIDKALEKMFAKYPPR